jgi:hypothetical protein
MHANWPTTRNYFQQNYFVQCLGFLDTDHLRGRWTFPACAKSWATSRVTRGGSGRPARNTEVCPTRYDQVGYWPGRSSRRVVVVTMSVFTNAVFLILQFKHEQSLAHVNTILHTSFQLYTCIIRTSLHHKHNIFPNLFSRVNVHFAL